MTNDVRTRGLVMTAVVTTSAWWIAAGENDASRSAFDDRATAQLVSSKVLDAEIKSRIELLASQLKSPDYFDRIKKRILPQHGGMLACLALAYAQHPATTDDEHRAALLAIGRAAKELAAAPTYDEAKSAWGRIQAADAGVVHEAATARTAASWGTLIGTHPLMAEIDKQSRTLGKAFRGNKYTGEERHHLALLTLLTLPLDETDYGFADDDDRVQWQDFSRDLREHTLAAATALQNDDKPAATKSFLAAQKVCADCHSAFR